VNVCQAQYLNVNIFVSSPYPVIIGKIWNAKRGLISLVQICCFSK